MAASPLLQLPQELRDLVYDHLFNSDDNVIPEDSTAIDRRPKRLTTRHDRWQWDIQYPVQPPRTTHLNLIKTNRQLKHEVTDYLATLHRHKQRAARLEVLIDFPNITPTWTHIPAQPSQTTTLDLTVKIDKMYHPCFISRPPHNAILNAVIEVLKTFTSRGPFFAKPTLLLTPLHLETVRVTLTPPQPLEDMENVYGFPAQQLGALYRDFSSYVATFARSSLILGDVGDFEIRRELQPFKRFRMSRIAFAEGDYAFSRNGGYQ